MKTEKVVLSFIAILLGLIVAAGGFYFLQITKKTPSSQTKIVSTVSPTPTPSSSIFLTLDQPKDEEVVDSKTITISGKTRPDAVIAILINGVENVTTPSLSGNFSIPLTIGNGQNIIEVIAVAADGESKSISRTVTYSEEDF
ncbi:MAG: hypothetical protein HYT07_04180 [Candidatus Levybacteria bacterium]|nr:hypothetical protein [Candidatus Levybacteria bacterium]